MTATLSPDTIYLIGDRFACGTPRCAGFTAVTTGRGLHGEKITAVTPADVREWATYDLGPLTCECGNRTAEESK